MSKCLGGIGKIVGGVVSTVGALELPPVAIANAVSLLADVYQQSEENLGGTCKHALDKNIYEPGGRYYYALEMSVREWVMSQSGFGML